MDVIYEPRGAALEYSPLACNLRKGCTHGCLYCYAPACLRMAPEEFHARSEPRERIIERMDALLIAQAKTTDRVLGIMERQEDRIRALEQARNNK